jgi:hypothetical protein
LEAAEEEVPMNGATKAAWKKALDHVMAIMARNAPFNADVPRIQASPLTNKQKALIRDSWYLARRNADIAPKVFLKYAFYLPLDNFKFNLIQLYFLNRQAL